MHRFSLVEIIAVIVILGILSATIVPKLGNITTTAEDALIQGCVNQLNGLEAMFWAKETRGGTYWNATIAENIFELVLVGAKTDEIVSDLNINHDLFGKDFTIIYNAGQSDLWILIDENHNQLWDTGEIFYCMLRFEGSQTVAPYWELDPDSRGIMP